MPAGDCFLGVLVGDGRGRPDQLASLVEKSVELAAQREQATVDTGEDRLVKPVAEGEPRLSTGLVLDGPVFGSALGFDQLASPGRTASRSTRRPSPSGSGSSPLPPGSGRSGCTISATDRRR